MKLLFLLLAPFCINLLNVTAQGRFLLNPVHLIDSARSAITGIGTQVAQRVLSPRELLRGSKQVLFGLPEVAVFRTIHELCKLNGTVVMIKYLKILNYRFFILVVGQY